MPARGASGGLAGASVWKSNQPKNQSDRGLHGRRFQADRGRLSYIQTQCLRASPAGPPRRRFAVRDQTEMGVHDR
jgi:hypothetical protein